MCQLLRPGVWGGCYWREQIDKVSGLTEIIVGPGLRLGYDHVMLLEQEDDQGKKLEERPERWERTE